MSALDRRVALSPAILQELARPATVIAEALSSGNGEQLFDYLRTLRQVGQISGINLAQALYLTKQHWEDGFDPDGKPVAGLKNTLNIEDEMEDVIASRVGVTVQTFKKYTRAWAALHDRQTGVVPKPYREAVMVLPWEWQLLLPAAAPDLTQTQWKSLARAQHKNDVRAVVQVVRGKQTSGHSALGITVRRNGQVEGFQNGKRGVAGVLNIKSKDPLVQAVITRIIKGAGIKME